MLDRNDARITAYAMGELDEAGRAEVERAIAADPSLADEIGAIRDMGTLLQQGLNAEPVLPVIARSSLRRRVFGIAAVAAACLAIGFGGGMLVSHGPGREMAATSQLSEVAPATQPQIALDESTKSYWAAALHGRTPDFNLEGSVAAPQPLLMGGHAGNAPATGTPSTPAVPASEMGPRSPFLYMPASPSQPRMYRQSAVVGRDVADRERGVQLRVELADVDGDGIANGVLPNVVPVEAEERNAAELYDRVIDNPFLTVSANPLSTFSVDVDTASYSNIRRMLRAGQLPPADAVRIEEMINYFHYDDAPPKDGKPFATHIEVASAPWAPSNRLVRVALKGQIIQNEQRPPSNLVFLIDVSGSMNQPNKLPLLKDSLAKLVGELRDTDTVSIVVYAGNSGLVLPATRASDKATIYSALDKLEAGGSTNGGQGIALAYDTAQQQFIKDGTNRVILCTDGDFNVGITDRAELLKLVEDRAKGGVYLTILGFGMGNYKDATMEELSNKGNGNYAYIDTHREAEKVFIEQLSGTLVTIAKDVKLQIEFNPSKVASYRLIGYENRILAAEDFNDDRKDAGDIGAGHSVVALYEIVPAEQVSAGDAMAVDPLRYQTPATRVEDAKIASELLTVKLRYKSPDSPAEPGTSQLIETPVVDTGKSFEQTSEAFRWTTAVAAAGMTLRNSTHRGTASLEMALQIADKAMTVDPGHHRQEFVSLLKTAQALSGNPQK